MLRPSFDAHVFVYRDPVDMRKSINGLAAIVEAELGHSPMNGALFVFCNRSRDKVKLLYWERNGFVLWYKRLEKHKFKWLNPQETKDSIEVTGKQLNQLLDGLDIFQQPHQSLFYDNVG
ncbi:transposase [Thiosulfatimonas sediminis]|uniref:Transposase n=1 Tax=Thiosulfatimonas sediminis TaxID=2675054 RepID=A0A6F8PUH7_9GAMM|nr:IS66 family insertion sequence element accessory protein TnpB [Thiosulfatimonas sediminis]BBP45630.1 transposase [Thiosulfatimonas sediminis]BBP45636.1 transposase [Thiosulfatimonas sediminis]